MQGQVDGSCSPEMTFVHANYADPILYAEITSGSFVLSHQRRL